VTSHLPLRPLLDLKDLLSLHCISQLPSQDHSGSDNDWPLERTDNISFDYIRDEDVESLTSAWPHLNEEPLIDQHPTTSLTLSCLKSFATHCPGIEEISLFMDGTRIPEPIVHQGVRLDSLDVLSCGVYPIEDPQRVALSLSNLTINTGLEISTDRGWSRSL
jgi:hypothetical protein